MKQPTEFFQSVIIIFSDGTKAVFTGKAVCWVYDKRTVDEIFFTSPKQLPKDCYFGQIDT